MDELQRVDDWLTAPLANLEPAAHNRMMRQLAQQQNTGCSVIPTVAAMSRAG